MATRKNEGKSFEEQIENSCEKLSIFHQRIKDTYIPFNVRELLNKRNMRLPTSKNKYDFFVFSEGHLFTLELKSVNAKSISITDPKIIKPHQVEELQKASEYDKVIAGFIFNFRATEDNEVYFVPIDKYIEYRDIATNGKDHNYKSKINKSSIPVGICEEIGIRIESRKKITTYHYHMREFINKAIALINQ